MFDPVARLIDTLLRKSLRKLNLFRNLLNNSGGPNSLWANLDPQYIDLPDQLSLGNDDLLVGTVNYANNGFSFWTVSKR